MYTKSHKTPLLWISAILIALALVGCSKTGTEPRDPYENFNRKMFAFNEAVDTAIATPLATIYNGTLPHPVRSGIANVFSNIAEIPSIIGHLLQGNPRKSAQSAWRLIINSVFGLGGIFDVASRTGIEKEHTDFGVTFAKWGDRDAPFLVLPLLGPSTPRDTLGSIYDISILTPFFLIDSKGVRWALTGLGFISRRAGYLDAEKILEEATLDRYVLQRDAYLQYRDERIRLSYGEEAIDPYVEDDDEDSNEDLFGDEDETSTEDSKTETSTAADKTEKTGKESKAKGVVPHHSG